MAGLVLVAINALVSSGGARASEAPLPPIEAPAPSATPTRPEAEQGDPTGTVTPTPQSQGTADALTRTLEAVHTSVAAVVKTEGYNLRMRSGPGVLAEIVESLAPSTQVRVVGRTEDSQWLEVIAPDGKQGWLAGQWVEVSGELTGVPVTIDSEAAATLQAEAAQEASPSGYAYISNITGAARQIFLNGQSLGNRPNVFSKVGDSITDTTEFLDPIGTGQYNLGGYQYLQPVIDYYSAERAFDRNSFANTSLAAVAGWSSREVIDPGSADQDYCLPNESPLVCEYRVVQPSVSLILIGTNDLRATPTDVYEKRMREIIQTSINMGVIPVVSTIPPFIEPGTAERVTEFNDLIRRLAQEYGVPLWDYWAALQYLPNQGISPDGMHPSVAVSGDFTSDNLQYGMTVRNLTALQALDAVWRQVIG